MSGFLQAKIINSSYFRLDKNFQNEIIARKYSFYRILVDNENHKIMIQILRLKEQNSYALNSGPVFNKNFVDLLGINTRQLKREFFFQWDHKQNGYIANYIIK